MPAANDLAEDESSGIEGRGLKKRKASGGKKGSKKKAKLSNACGDSWETG